MREINRFARKQAWTFRGKGPNGRNLCFCGCDREVVPPRRSCFSDECLAWYTSHSSPDHIRGKVYDRDKGVCAHCGKKDCSWEADHIIPVIEGGGGCDFTGYRTLCLSCHKKETAALAARRAAKRREALTKASPQLEWTS